MKSVKNKSLSVPKSVTLALAAALLVTHVLVTHVRADEWPDVNGATAGSGITNNGAFSWEDSMWTVVSAGNIATMNWTNGAFIRLAASTDAGANNYAITANANHTFAGIFLQANGGGTVTINGTGILTIGDGFQGFLVNGSSQSLFIYNTLAGTGGVEKNLSGSLFLYGTNTYSGGTRMDTAGGLNFNNPYSFGTGPISWNANQQVLACPAATSPIVLTNAMVTRAASQLIFVSPTAGPVTITGPWTNAAGVSRLTMNNAATKLTIAGNIYGSTGNILKDGPGTLVITGTNANTVTTTVTNGLLEIGATGSIAGTVNVQPSAGVLQLDGPTSLNSSVTLMAVSSRPNSVNLNFSGTNTIFALYIDGVLQNSGTWGATGSGANNENAIFTGTGFLKVPAAPVIVQEPQSLTTIPQAPAHSFTVLVTGDQPSMTFQWKLNNNNLTDDGITISGSQTSQLTLHPPYTAGTYTCAITNAAGFTNTLPATLTILATNDYVNAIAASAPVAYWRLDEPNGAIANDVYGQHQGVYINANLGQPGFSEAPGSDPAITVPANASQKGYMVVSNSAPDFSFTTFPFTLEAWAYSTNFSAKQRLISTLTVLNSANGGYGFGMRDDQTLQYTAGGVDEFDAPVGGQLAGGIWYHFVITCDGNNYVAYLNGKPLATHAILGTGASPQQLALGNNPLGYPTEQLYGGIDEVAIYNYALDQLTVTNHYLARYSDQPLTVATPVVTPPTNYVSLSSTLTESAGGVGLTYQWYKGAGTGSPVAGGTDSTLTIGPLQLSDAGNYHVVVTDAGNHTADSPLAYLAVLPIPTSASDLNVTNGLVLHLPFDSDYKDVSGRANDSTPVGSPFFAAGGVIGTSALHYGTTNGVATNYVTLGVVPDLQFGATTNFSVSYWVRGTVNTNLPFFCDSTNGIAGIIAFNGGYYFGPDTAGDGGWAVGLGSTTHEMTTSGANIINDGNWHHLVHVANRAGNMTTYLDGAQVDNHAISFITDSIDTTNAANIGQDGTGALVFTQDQGGDIDDLGVWRRPLTSLEVSGIYLAGATNHVSFAPAVNPIVRAALQIVQVSPGQYQIVWTGGGTLQASGDVTGTYTNVPSATSPYPISTSSTPQLFYRLKY